MDEEFDDVFLQSRPWEPEEPNEEKVNFENVSSSLEKADLEKQLKNIMDCILPPKTKEVQGKRWKARASTVPATRFDLVTLEEKLDAEIKERGAKEFGVCPIRRELYDQLFVFGKSSRCRTFSVADELIRQVTVECAERGLILLRVRDEMRMSILAYQSLLESSIAYGIRKAITVENEQTRAVVERDEERAKNETLLTKVAQLEKQIVNDKMLNEEELETLEQRMREENERLLESNKILKNQLQAILQMEGVSGIDPATAQSAK